MQIIGLGTKARQGKDVLAEQLRNEYGFTILHFADALKDECRQIFNWSASNKNILAHEAICNAHPNFLWEAPLVTNGHPVALKYNERKGCLSFFNFEEEQQFFTDDNTLLQFWAECQRYFDPEYWIKATFKKMFLLNSQPPHPHKFVISDLRYRNEKEWIEVLGGRCFRVIRRNPDGTQYIDPERNRYHPSETDLDHVKMDEILSSEFMIEQLDDHMDGEIEK